MPRQAGRRARMLLALSVVFALQSATVALADTALDERFARADASTGAMFRWWWPGAQVEDAELVRELEAIDARGLQGRRDRPRDGRCRLCRRPRPLRLRHRALEPRRADRAGGRGSPGLQVDLTVGARWPIAVPGLDVNGPASAKELTYGLQLVRGGAAFSGPVPAPAPKTYEDRTFENGATRTTTRRPCPASSPPPRWHASSRLRRYAHCRRPRLRAWISRAASGDGRLDWTPPDARTWVVTGSWYRGTAQRNDAPFGNLAYPTSDPEPPRRRPFRRRARPATFTPVLRQPAHPADARAAAADQRLVVRGLARADLRPGVDAGVPA